VSEGGATGLPRLQKVIAASGLCSRRKAEEWIAQGRVTVDGSVALLGDRVDPEQAHVEVDGIPLPVRAGQVTYLLNKPRGVVSTARDPQGRRTVVDLVPAEPRVVPVGRLDADSEGLILLSNDGDLAQLVTHPRHEVTKTYAVLVEGVPTASTLRRLTEGVVLDDGPARARAARLLGRSGSRAHVEVVMGEGRKREVRRMLETVGHPVLRLFRSAVGPIRDSTLKSGKWRELTLQEIRALYEAAGRRSP
jgi:23S rRNA pseudouridine2605 synthase